MERRRKRAYAAMPSIADLYLDLLEQTLTGVIVDDPGYYPSAAPEKPYGFNAEARELGDDWPVHAQTMVGVKRLKHLRYCVDKVIADRVPGDFIETGVWRGGACIFMRAALAARHDVGRKVWVCDSFEGLPEPDERYPQDAPFTPHLIKFLAVSLEEVRRNFQKYGMLDDQVVFLPGWFKDTLPTAPIEKLAILRLDGDMYGSTMDALENLYPKLSPGGFLIVDDYAIPRCRRAIEDYRSGQGITEEILPIDGTAVFWRRAMPA
jgi:hypothetical protein